MSREQLANGLEKLIKKKRNEEQTAFVIIMK